MDKIIDNKKIYSKKTYNKVIYSYIFYLYQAKFRLKKIEKNNKLKNALKKDINQRIYLSKKEKRILSLKQKIKLFIYKYFNNIAFEIKIYRNRKRRKDDNGKDW